MKLREAVLVGAVIAAGTIGASCSGPDPGAITFFARPGPSGTPQGGSSSTTSTGAPADAAVEAAPPPDPIFGTAAFEYHDPGVVANSANPAHQGSVEGKNCMVPSCHADGAKVWVFAGTLYNSPAGAATEPKGQIKVVGPGGVEIGTTYTDANGNFWLAS